MKETAVEWLIHQLITQNEVALKGENYKLFELAKEREKEQSHSYAEFAIRCNRKDMKILNFEDWIKL